MILINDESVSYDSFGIADTRFPTETLCQRDFTVNVLCLALAYIHLYSMYCVLNRA